jgi:hypothetical protein
LSSIFRRRFIVYFSMYSSKKYIDISHGDIAQLARAPALQAGGQGFDSLYLHHANIKHSYNMKMFEKFEIRFE